MNKIPSESEQAGGGVNEPNTRVDEYIDALPSPQKTIASSLRELIRVNFPELSEVFKWHVPMYAAGMKKKKNLLSINAYSAHVNLYFYNGVSLDDPLSRLEGIGKQVRHLSFHSSAEIDEDYICQLITQAIHIAGKL